MLAQLTISNFAIVRELEIDFQPGMTAITGETGAGKSIAIDALGLCLGNRADGNVVRPGAARADICARFSLADTPSARAWLEQNQLDDSNECLLRRVINADGRSRGFINGTAVPLSQLRELGQRLIQIHGQHAHQLLPAGAPKSAARRLRRRTRPAGSDEPGPTNAGIRAAASWRTISSSPSSAKRASSCCNTN